MLHPIESHQQFLVKSSSINPAISRTTPGHANHGEWLALRPSGAEFVPAPPRGRQGGRHHLRGRYLGSAAMARGAGHGGFAMTGKRWKYVMGNDGFHYFNPLEMKMLMGKI